MHTLTNVPYVSTEPRSLQGSYDYVKRLELIDHLRESFKRLCHQVQDYSADNHQSRPSPRIGHIQEGPMRRKKTLIDHPIMDTLLLHRELPRYQGSISHYVKVEKTKSSHGTSAIKQSLTSKKDLPQSNKGRKGNATPTTQRRPVLMRTTGASYCLASTCCFFSHIYKVTKSH